MKAPSKDLMNSLTHDVLTLASYDSVGDNSLQTQMEQCIKLISVFPMLAVYSYHAYNYYLNDSGMYIHRPRPGFRRQKTCCESCAPTSGIPRWKPMFWILLFCAHGARRRQ